MSGGRLARNAGWAVLGSALSTPLGLLFSVLTARWLSVADNGVLQAALSLGLLVAMVTLGGWADGVVFGVRRLGWSPARVVGDALATSVLTFAALCGLTAAFGEAVAARLLPGASPTSVWLAVIIVGLVLAHRVMAAAARAVDRFPAWTAAVTAQQGARVLGVAALWVAVAPSAEAALGAVAVAEALAVGVLAARILPVTGLRLAWEPARWGRLASFSGKAMLQNLGMEVHERVDLFLLAWILADPEVLAIYGLAVSLATRVRRLTAPIATAAFPELADRTPEAAARVAARVLRANFVYTVAIAVGLALGAPLMPLVFGAAYAPAVPVLWVLLLAVTALAGHRILAQYFSAVDRQLVNVLVLLASLAVNVGLNLWWIPEHGALGAAAASLVSYAVETALSLALFARSSGLGLRAILVPEPDELSGLLRRLRGRLRRR